MGGALRPSRVSGALAFFRPPGGLPLVPPSLSLSRIRKRAPRGAGWDSESAPGVTSERPKSEMVDIEFTLIFTCSGAPRSLRCRSCVLPKEGAEAVPIPLPNRGDKKGSGAAPEGARRGGGPPDIRRQPPPVALRREKADIDFTLLFTCSETPWQGTWQCSKLTGSAALASAPILGTCTLPP